MEVEYSCSSFHCSRRCVQSQLKGSKNADLHTPRVAPPERANHSGPILRVRAADESNYNGMLVPVRTSVGLRRCNE